MVAKKRKSKRQTLQVKYKIVKRTKEHHRRLNKGAIEGSHRKKINDSHIPNAWPYKEELLKEIQSAKVRMEEFRVRQKEKRQEEIQKRRQGASSASSMELDQDGGRASKNLLSDPAPFGFGNDVAEDMGDDSFEMKAANLGQNSRRAYLRELRKVVEGADVILQVLDARDPVGTRSTAVEEMVMSNYRKKLVYVLNKADLVPRDVLSGWLAFLRQSHPTVPFKCNTQTQKGNLGRATGKADRQHEGGLQTTQAVGAEELIGLLKNYARVGDTKSIIAVGVVGFPNVGKSSLINSLMRSRAVGVSSMPGFTRVSQEVILDKNIRLIDSPGIVFADGDSVSTALRNCVNVEEMEDVMTPIQAILERCPTGYLMQLYSIPKFKDNDVMGFLALVARATGKLKKGGVPNVDAAARSVLHDWNDGKIKYYCRPPALSKGGGAGEVDTQVLSAFSKELDIASLYGEGDVRVLDALDSSAVATSYVPMDDVAGLVPSASAFDVDIGSGATGAGASSSRSKTMKSTGKAASQGEAAKMDDDDEDDEGWEDCDEMEEEEEEQIPVKGRGAARGRGMQPTGSVDKQSEPKGKPEGTGVLARNATIMDEELPSVDPRKAAKKVKKKAGKDKRREGSSGGGGSAYSFEEDFQY